MRSIRLKAGCGIGMKILGRVYPKPIASACAGGSDTEKIPAWLSFQRMKCPLRVFRRAFFQNKIDMLSLGSPNTKVSFIFTNQFCSNRITPFCARHHVRLRLSNRFGNFSFPVQHR